MKVLFLAALLAARAAGAQEASGTPAQPAAPAPPPLAAPLAPSPAAPAARVLTLAEAEQSARERQPQLAQARAQTEAANARADEAFSPLLPQVSGTASYQRSTGNFVASPGSVPTGVRTGGSSWDTFSYWRFGVTGSQLLWDFGQTSGRWRASQAAASAQLGSERATASQVLLTVRNAFFNAREQKALVAVAQDNLRNQEAHLAQVEAFVRMGTRPAVDLAQARADRANARVQLINAENAYATSRAQLNQAMGVTAPTDYEVADESLPAVEGEGGALDALVSEAERNRPDLVALQEQARAQELAVGAARGAYGPALGVSTGLTEAGPALDNLVWNWNATVNLTWNLFQGGLTRATVAEARANLSAAQAQAEVLRQQIRVDVDTARLAVRASQESIGAADEVLLNARERLRLAERRYQEGVGSLLDVSDAQLAVTNAAAQRAQADYNLSSSRAQLVRALGREVPRG